MPESGDASATAMLGKVPIFASLGEKVLRQLAAGAKDRRFGAGEKILTQGEKGIGLFLILEGKVEVRSKEKLLASLGPSQYFGEMALLDEEPRTADVVAIAPTRCLVISRWEFWGFLSDKPDAIRILLQETVRRLRATDRAFTE
ncbi:MAG TPA: cyclic nucleotide-binding domain-containing protein [Thermoplasmata archaeon]|nr:cyclic nucleotide-binding domain-containing protein [Thermoplasmata archaeon]